MAKIAVLVPREYMKDQTEHLLNEDLKDMQREIQTVKVIETSEAVREARNAIGEGVHIVVARGVQAMLIKEYTKIPVVDIALTAQDIGLLMLEAKKLTNKERPKIAIVSLGNMLSDLTYFNQLFDIDLRIYCPQSLDYIDAMVQKALDEGAEIIVGGDMAHMAATGLGVPSLFMASTEDSMRNALLIAKKMSYTADVEKNSNAQFETMLDTAFNGIIKINREQKIIIVNRMIEDLVGRSTEDISGELLQEEFSQMDREYIQSVLDGKREMYSTSVKIREIPMMIMVAPIQYDNDITGAIISCQKLETTIRASVKTMQDMYLSGYVAKTDFSKFYSKDKKVRDSVELAKKYAISKYPVLIYGEEGTEKDHYAQSIHNNSARKNAPFVAVNVSGLSEEKQIKLLFGDTLGIDVADKRGACRTANYGTLYIAEVEKLSPECQYRLFQMIKYPSMMKNSIGQNQNLDIRIIVSAINDLCHCVQEGTFRKDLYYCLNGLSLHIPPLRTRSSDIEYLVNRYLDQFTKTFARFLKISDAAMDVLKQYTWEGNELQLENFCERLFITAPRNTIDDGTVRVLLEELYPSEETVDEEGRIVVYKHPEAEKIASLLKEYGGNRSAVANALDISTTTLWRKMKKYGITNTYDV